MKHSENKNIKDFSISIPYSYKLRDCFEQHKNRNSNTYTQTEMLNMIMKLAVKRETQDNNILNNFVNKEQYFAVLFDVLENSIFADS
jgi:hypothetical protein